MEEFETESDHIKEVYAQYGLAMYQAQCVERQLAILLATKYGPGIGNITGSQYDELLQNLFKKTFGGLIQKLRQIIDIPDDFEKSIAQSIEYRNWLAHHYFWEKAGHFMSENGRAEMIDELKNIIDYLDDFDQQLIEISKKWCSKNGITEDIIDQQREILVKDI